MKFYSKCLSICFALCATATGVLSQQSFQKPEKSQKAGVIQRLGLTDIRITYSRPAVTGRKVFGDWPTNVPGEVTLDNSGLRPDGAPLAPRGHLCRTGANEATNLVQNHDAS